MNRRKGKLPVLAETIRMQMGSKSVTKCNRLKLENW